mmetsp:Transcript_3093/g.10200  ORF Transcript_3093/g.10200 Transcript_3093/m.10200 type:complete len:557 (-) Transcript_3093:434-2104(-)|eukprot:CAMPEP_0118918006 /NCGR_PEP_ID=MMETSP1166-20130328/17651_1 /TAXON_ID=1104430 /ORGANISM="Chrysoreinhardia sp, Strain CCMP3193" /LENGTH=556 /DNA_ID=CAMNT_0006858241 /DNA_START=66 /DNA_END=1736 /DNA_ORIENTATION=-
MLLVQAVIVTSQLALGFRGSHPGFHTQSGSLAPLMTVPSWETGDVDTASTLICEHKAASRGRQYSRTRNFQSSRLQREPFARERAIALEATANVDQTPRRLGQSTLWLALDELRRGNSVVVTDDARRENEGDLIMASQLATQSNVAFMVRHTSGVICVAMRGSRLDELNLQPMVWNNEDPKGTAFAVSVDLRGKGVTTGISASDRAATLRALSDEACDSNSFCRPGHVFPLRARPGGVLERGGHTEAAVDLAELAGLYPAGALCEIVRDFDGEVARAADLEIFRKQNNLVMTTIEDLRAFRLGTSKVNCRLSVPMPLVRRGPSTRLPTRFGRFDIICFTQANGLEHIALVRGFLKAGNANVEQASASDVSKLRADIVLGSHSLPGDDDSAQFEDSTPGGNEVPLVRVHSECATGDIFASRRCDCGEQLERAMINMAREPASVLLYIRGHEGRGIGLPSKLTAYALQDQGCDTVEANEQQGLPIDARCYSAAAAMLGDLGINTVRLMTNNPAKCDALRALGVKVQERVPVITTPNSDNYEYLRTKQSKLGHILNIPS